MVIFGIDAHKRTHTVVAVDAHGRQLGGRTLGTTTAITSRCCAGPNSSRAQATAVGGRGLPAPCHGA